MVGGAQQLAIGLGNIIGMDNVVCTYLDYLN